MNLKILNALVVRAPPKYRLYDFLIGLLQVKRMNIENCVADCIVGFINRNRVENSTGLRCFIFTCNNEVEGDFSE